MTGCRAAVLLSPLVLLATACQTSPSPATCQAAPLQWAVGLSADEPTLRQLAAQAGPVLINPVGPASIVSRDHRSDRLRLYLDSHNRITALRCE